MRTTFVTLGGFSLAFLAFGELGLAYPIPGWLYLLALVVFAASLIRPSPIRSQPWRVAATAAAMAVVAALYFVEWTTRKPFLRDLSKIRTGMTETEVRQIMGRYLEGTGWPTSPICVASPATDGRAPEGTGSHNGAVTSGAGHLTLPNSLVFRHSNAAKFNSDWGIIAFSDAKVVGVSFNAD